MSRRPAPASFWRFSLRVYRAPGVQEACLALQEHCGADVNLLLFCGWTGRHGRELDAKSLREAIGRVAGWQSEVIAPLRLARRGLRRQCGDAAAVAQSFRKRFSSLELDLERAEQALLANLYSQWAFPPSPVPRRQAIAANLARYLSLLEKPANADQLARLAHIARTCGPAAPPVNHFAAG